MDIMNPAFAKIYPQHYFGIHAEQMRAMNLYNKWQKRTNVLWFEGTDWQEWQGNWTRRSKCGVYRLVVMSDRIRIVTYRLANS
jgi:hypothetical protein